MLAACTWVQIRFRLSSDCDKWAALSFDSHWRAPDPYSPPIHTQPVVTASLARIDSASTGLPSLRLYTQSSGPHYPPSPNCPLTVLPLQVSCGCCSFLLCRNGASLPQASALSARERPPVPRHGDEHVYPSRHAHAVSADWVLCVAFTDG